MSEKSENPPDTTRDAAPAAVADHGAPARRQPPQQSAATRAAKAAQKERLAAQLRENLRRRKAQARALDDG